MSDEPFDDDLEADPELEVSEDEDLDGLEDLDDEYPDEDDEGY